MNTKTLNSKCKKCSCLQYVNQTFGNTTWLNTPYYDCIVNMTNECIGKSSVYNEKKYNKPYSSYKQLNCFGKKVTLTKAFNTLSYRYLLESYNTDNDNECSEYLNIVSIS
jgi:hypothetical protein